MCTNIRPELSEKNKYWIERHRYYELKHFCLQYPVWKKSYLALEGMNKPIHSLNMFSKPTHYGDPTASCAIAKTFYSDRMKMIERCAVKADQDLAIYILRAVTEELSYIYLKNTLDIPCSKDTYYDRYRRFFWLLNKARQ